MTRLAPRRVAPFGHLGITVCVRLPRAFRSLPRPSSPSCAQASPTRLRSLDHNYLVKQSTRDLLRAATGTWRLGVSCASTSELFASPARPTACRRSRNCVTCVDSIDSPHAVNAPRRLTTTRIACHVGYPTITTSIRCQTANSTNTNNRGRVSRTARTKAIWKIEIEMGVSRRATNVERFQPMVHGLLAAPLRR